MKKLISAVIILLIISMTTAFAEEALTVKLPVIDGKICGYGIYRDGQIYSEGATSYVKKMRKQKCKVSDERRYKGKNTEVLEEKWLDIPVSQIVFVSNRFSSAQEAIYFATISTRPGYGGIGSFNEEGRKSVSIDVVITFHTGITMAIGTCGNVTGLVRYMDESVAQARFSAGKEEEAHRVASQEAQATLQQQQQEEAVAAYTIGSISYTSDGGMIISSTQP